MKMFKKRLTGLLSIGLIVLIMFCGCKKTESGMVTLTIWEQDEEDSVKIFDGELVPLFEKLNPNIKIDRVHYENEDLRSNFQTAALSGEGPALIMSPNDNIGPFVVGGLITPINELMDQSYLDLFDSSILASSTMDGNIYAIPMVTGNNIAMLYNKKLIDPPPTTFEEIINLSQKYPPESGIFPLAYNEAEAFWMMGFLGGFGGNVFDEQGNITLNTPEMVKTLQFIHDMKFKNKIMPKQAGYDEAQALFREGKAATFLNGPWAWISYEKGGVNEITDFEWDVTLFPKVVGGNWGLPYYGSKGYSVNANITDKKTLDAVKKFLEFVASKEFQLAMAKSHYQMPSTKEALADPSITGEKWINATIKQMKQGAATPIRAEMRAIWDAIGPELRELMSGKSTPEKAAKKMQEKAIKLAKGITG